MHVQISGSEVEVQLLRTEKQRDNLAKFFWDTAKVSFAVLVLTPLAKPEAGEVISFSIGTLSGGVLLSVGYLLDGMEVQI